MRVRSNRRERRERRERRAKKSLRSLRALRLIPVLMALAGGLAIVARVEAQSRPFVAPAAAAIYERLLPQISRIKIFDHHAHPAWPDDPDVDIAPPPPGSM